MAAAALAEAWRANGAAAVANVEGVYGRLVYLRPDADEFTATLVAPHRRAAFVADGASWAGPNFGRSAQEILLRNGVEAEWIQSELSLGTRFKLVLFDDDDGAVWPADWAGVQRVVEAYYPELASKVQPHWAALKAKSWEQLEEQAGAAFSELDARDGPMTAARYASAEDTAPNARRFLAAALSLNRLFAGTGFTSGGTAEFFAANRALADVPRDQIVELRPRD